jgi:hypothetical protein
VDAQRVIAAVRNVLGGMVVAPATHDGAGRIAFRVRPGMVAQAEQAVRDAGIDFHGFEVTFTDADS